MPSKPLKAIKPMFERHKWKLVRGDLVEIIRGKDKGLQGRILKVFRDVRFPRIIVEGRNMVKKHLKRQGVQRGFVVSMEAPLHYSNVLLVDPVTGKPVRCGIKYTEDGTKVRVGKGKHASGAIIPKPEGLRPPVPNTPIIGHKDTLPEHVEERTYGDSSDLPQHLRIFSQHRTFTTGSFAHLAHLCSSRAAGGGSSSRAAGGSSSSSSNYSSCSGSPSSPASSSLASRWLWSPHRLLCQQAVQVPGPAPLWRWRTLLGSTAQPYVV